MKLQGSHGRLALRLAALVTFAGVFNVPALTANAALLPREHVDFQADFETTNALHGWDWSYHAFREWSGWSVEHGPDRNNTAPVATPTDRQRLLQHWFAQNQKPAW